MCAKGHRHTCHPATSSMEIDSNSLSVRRCHDILHPRCASILHHTRKFIRVPIQVPATKKNQRCHGHHARAIKHPQHIWNPQISILTRTQHWPITIGPNFCHKCEPLTVIARATAISRRTPMQIPSTCRYVDYAPMRVNATN